MKTYNVQKRVNTGSNTEIFDTVSFDCLDKAEEKFIEILAVQETYAGECNDNDFRDYYQEEIEIDCFDDETDEFEQIKSVTVENGITGKNEIARQITCIHNCLKKLMPTMNIKHIRQFCLQGVKPLRTQFLVNSTTAVKVCAT